MSLLDNLQRILEHSHNGYAFRYHCEGLQIVLEIMPDNSLVAYYADNREGRITIDTSRPPFDRIMLFS